MKRLLDVFNKSLTITALAVFSATAAVNGGYERILELENQKKNELINSILMASIDKLMDLDTRSINL